jgi:hypothetical protein
MKKISFIVFTAFLIISCGPTQPKSDDSATKNPIQVKLDLNQSEKDIVPVVVDPGRFKTDTETYRIPRVVQGTYSVSDFGKYVQDFKALDYEGNELTVEKIDTNSWVISDAVSLDQITYNVNDTYDIETNGGIGGEQPFSPAGTNIEPENYVLNLHGFVGYFDSLKNNQYALSISAPSVFI